MTTALDATHDPARRSFVASANGHPDFPIQNLPLAVFMPAGGSAPRIGSAIGDAIVDLAAMAEAGLLATLPADVGAALRQPTLNALFALGAPARRALRAQLSAALASESPDAGHLSGMIHGAGGCTLVMPADVGDYTDFYVGIHHATNVGKVFRPDNPLLPNYKYVPIGYHGRASSLVVSGTPVHRPNGQRKLPDETAPSFGACRSLDFELELGIWIGPGNRLGHAIPIAAAGDHIAGYCLLNDWSARDIQAWEYQPLGPFLAKNFASTVSPWVITPEALAPFRFAQAPRPAGDPHPLPYLSDAQDQRHGALDLALEVLISTPRRAAAGHSPLSISHSSTRHMYWTPAQLVAHQTSNGCNLRPGDLLGSGTISTPDAGGLGSLLEMTGGGRTPLQLGDDEERRYLADGDEIILRARAVRDGYVSIGFGDCRGTIRPAPAG